MKPIKFIILLLSLLIISCANKISIKNSFNDWSKQNLNGKVKSLSLYEYNKIDSLGNVIKNCEKKKVRHILFDENGNITEHDTYDDYGGFKNKFIYDDKYNVIEEITYVGSFSSIQYKITNKYDAHSKLMESTLFNASGILKNKYNYKYDSKGKLNEKDCLNAKGSLEYINKYKYDNWGNQIEDAKYGSDSAFIGRDTYKYDSVGNKIEFCQFDVNDSLGLKETYKFDSQKNMIEKKDYKVASYYNNSERLHVFKYEFDKQGNWIKLTAIINDIPKYIEVRELEYY